VVVKTVELLEYFFAGKASGVLVAPWVLRTPQESDFCINPRRNNGGNQPLGRRR